MKALGAAYLVALGVRTLLAPGSVSGADASTPRISHRLFRDGVVVSVLNPKIALFFLAFLPQFVEPGRGAASQQVFLLGLLYVALALLTDSGYACFAGGLRGRLGSRLVRGPLPRRASGFVYIGLGVKAALAERG